MQDGLDGWSRHVAVGDGALGLAAQHGLGERDCARGTRDVSAGLTWLDGERVGGGWDDEVGRWAGAAHRQQAR